MTKIVTEIGKPATYAKKKKPLPDTSELQTLDQNALTREKTILEIENLIRSNDAIAKAAKKNLIDSLLKAGGYLSALFLLVTGVTGPINTYFHERNDEQSIILSKEIRTVLDSGNDAAIKRSVVIQLSLDHPRITAPIVLKSFNDGFITAETMTEIYKNMYQMSESDIYYETLLDKIAAFTAQSNKNILEKVLLNYSSLAFKAYLKNADQAGAEKATAYILLIKELQLDKEASFQKGLIPLRQRCKTVQSDVICAILNTIQ